LSSLDVSSLPVNADQLTTTIELGVKVVALLVLAYALSQARRVTNDVVANAGQFGDDNERKRKVVFRAIFNFYIAFAIVIVVCGLFGLFQGELFVGALIALLTGLGVKMSYDIRD
jgi:hypothetical protein